ncbi:kinase-like domain-containing protein [Biscogniauxia marginata]|nr:kinase-like domain-containing protein [Biscogniauxia marginata]
MIKDDEKYFAGSGDITPGGPSTWYIVVWDQRRLISVTMDEELDSEDPAIEHLKKHIDKLGPDVYTIHVSNQGELISASTDPKDDNTRCVYYPPLDEIQRPDWVQTIRRSELQELDRLGPDVDLVIYPPYSQATGKKVVFKYYFVLQFMPWVWDEMNLLIRLPRHPNLVPFDRLVVDELAGRFVGFTTVYIPGGTLEENPSRVFKLKWLHQLTGVVDDLNLKYGIAHQDIAPRNILIDNGTDSLMLFDFNFSARIGIGRYSEHRNDVKGVIFTIYEIITGNTDLRHVPPPEQDLAAIEEQDKWVKHPNVTLDHPVSEFRLALKQWSEKRRLGRQLTIYKDASEYIDWPKMVDPPRSEFQTRRLDGTLHHYSRVCYDRSRTGLREKGGMVLNWERPPQNALKDGALLLATGEIIDSK